MYDLIVFHYDLGRIYHFEKTNKTFTNCFDGYPRCRCSDSRDNFFILTF